MSVQPLLQVSGLTRRFGGLVAVDGVEFTVNDGEILGLLGPNGSGKTTVLNMKLGGLAFFFNAMPLFFFGCLTLVALVGWAAVIGIAWVRAAGTPRQNRASNESIAREETSFNVSA